jgi:hypothetical protein
VSISLVADSHFLIGAQLAAPLEVPSMKVSWTYRLIFCRLVVGMAKRQFKTLGELLDELARDTNLVTECVALYPHEARKGGSTEGGPAATVIAALQAAGIVDITLGLEEVSKQLTTAIVASRPQPLTGGVECH